MPRRFTWATLPDDKLLQLRLKDLKVTVEGTWLERRLRDLYDELDYFKHGGILHYVLRHLVAA